MVLWIESFAAHPAQKENMGDRRVHAQNEEQRTRYVPFGAGPERLLAQGGMTAVRCQGSPGGLHRDCETDGSGYAGDAINEWTTAAG